MNDLSVGLLRKTLILKVERRPFPFSLRYWLTYACVVRAFEDSRFDVGIAEGGSRRGNESSCTTHAGDMRGNISSFIKYRPISLNPAN